MGEKIRAHARQHIISFNGRAYKYMQLVAPKYNLGLSQPLRDPWAANLAALASQFDFSSVGSNPGEFVMIPGKYYLNNDDARCPADRVDKAEWNTLLIGDHIASAALDIMNTLAPRDDDGHVDMTHYDVSKYKHKRKTLRRRLYKVALLAWQDDQIDDITTKLIRRDMNEGITDTQNHEHTYALLDNCQHLSPPFQPTSTTTTASSSSMR
jgi:hypothetical protein